MSFRVNARTILHLGSELISSDGVAFYELIKNSLDARSPEVRIEVVQRIGFHTYDAVLRGLGERRTSDSQPDGSLEKASGTWKDIRRLALDAVDPDAPNANELIDEISQATTKGEFSRLVREANYIEIDDDGEGMSATILKDVYLTIGTRNRVRQREEERMRAAGRGNKVRRGARVILGEKGLGRLSAMRLGDAMEVFTGARGEKRWNNLWIDWNDFANAADEDIGNIEVEPKKAGKKDESDTGTLIRITALTSDWSQAKLEEMASDHFSKLVDPFSRKKLPLTISYNGTNVEIPEFAAFILEHAHGVFFAEYRVDSKLGPRLHAEMDYRLRKRKGSLDFRGIDLANSANGASRQTLERVGPFSLEVYWFNRRILSKIEGIGDLSTVRRLLAMWAGGVSLYRDGFRVNPYGGLNDDWLDLDRHAFSTSGFKLNRGQVVGRANITKEGNPYLTDQTNREGLTDGPEKRAFVGMLSSSMEYFRGFVVDVDDELRRAERVNADDAIERFRQEDDRIEALLPRLVKALSKTAGGSRLSKQVKESLAALRAAAEAVEIASQAQEQERERVMHLASIGLLIEVLAHELYRATAGGLKTIRSARSGKDRRSVSVSLRVLEAQLRTLQKRLRVLDPLSTNARQTKEEFEITEWVGEIVDGYARQASRAKRIEFTMTIVPPKGRRLITAVKGMFVQVIENLLSNSVYWIVEMDQYDRGPGKAARDGDQIGSIEVTVEPGAGRVTVADSGPGIPEDRRETVFQPFFTTKRQKEGRGLGLYIARQIAEYHGGTLKLGEANMHGYINSLVWNFGGIEDE